MTRITMLEYKIQKFLKRNKHWVVLVDDEQAIRESVGDFLRRGLPSDRLRRRGRLLVSPQT
jgi:hypothetical protein